MTTSEELACSQSLRMRLVKDNAIGDKGTMSYNWCAWTKSRLFYIIIVMYNYLLTIFIARKCERPECVGVKAELEDVKKRIMQ